MMMSIILADDISYITGILILINIFISLFCNSYRANKWNRNYITRKIYVKEDNSKYLNIIVFNTKSWAENIYISCYINEIICWDFLLSKLPNEKSVRCKKLLIKYIMNNNINDSEEWWILSMKNAVENLKENLNEKEFNKIKIRIKEYENNECTCNNCNINILI